MQWEETLLFLTLMLTMLVDAPAKANEKNTKYKKSYHYASLTFSIFVSLFFLSHGNLI
jgi:hypothetical protein